MDAPQPIHLVIPFVDLDPTRLPIAARTLGTELFRRAVRQMFTREYEPLGGSLAISFQDAAVIVTWVPVEPSADPTKYAIELLKSGRRDAATPLLESALATKPDNIDARYNLGMALSDVGRLPEATAHLQRVVDAVPAHVNALVALGIAAQRAGDAATARRHFARAVEFDPDNGDAQRNLAAMLGNAGLLREAEAHFRAAHRLLPDDQRTAFGFARCLEDLGGAEREAEAAALYRKAIELEPRSEIAEEARRATSAMAARTLRSGHKSERLDAVMYCLSAMERFDSMKPAEINGIVLEIALLGRRGLDINDPQPKYRLKSLRGEFSGLNLTCLMYVGFKRIAPDKDAGIDLSAEYTAAQRLYGRKQGAG